MDVDASTEFTSDLIVRRSATPDTAAIGLTPHPSPSKSTNGNGKRSMQDAAVFQCKRRRAEHLAAVKRALQSWRFKTYCDLYSLSSFTAEAILPDDNLTTLASDAQIKTLDDVATMLKPPWILAKKHGEEILDLLKQQDEAEMARRQNVKRAKKNAKEIEKEAKQRQKDWDKENERERRARQKELNDNEVRFHQLFGTSSIHPTRFNSHQPHQVFMSIPSTSFFSTFNSQEYAFASVPPARFYSYGARNSGM